MRVVSLNRCVVRASSAMCERGVAACVAVMHLIADGERREMTGGESRRYRRGRMANVMGGESSTGER